MRFQKKVLPAVVGGILVAGAVGIATAQLRTGSTPAAASTSVARPWAAAGGDVGVRWNRELAADLGIDIQPSGTRATRAKDGSERFALKPANALQFRVDAGYLRGLVGGSLQADGGYTLALKDGRIDLAGFRLQPRRGADASAIQFDLVDAKGQAWFYVDRVMSEVFDADSALAISTSDIRITDQLARRLGKPFVAGWTLGEIQLDLPVIRRGGGGVAPLAATIKWHGDAAPNGGIYQNDLFMLYTSAQYSRCQGCTGENGSGQLAITPSSTLRNNVNEGNIAATVPNDPLGTSSVRYTASIPWHQKFSGQFPPYNNDQHPYLIWNMYRLNADGSIEQIGRSGVKQAYLTTNGSCLDAGDHNSHVLGRGCNDTYSVSNNDYTQGLSPRGEILPATGQWARCGSTFDPDCNGSMNTGPGDMYWQRMLVGESQIAPSRNPGASYLFESWYLARQDVNIYNSMSTLTTTQQYSGVWNVSSGNERLGSAIDRWFGVGGDAPRNPRLTREPKMIKEVVSDGARAKVAVKVVRMPGTRLWQYHYAVMNFEFAFAETSGAEPNLRMESSQGFDGFSLATSSGAAATSPVFRDGDLMAGNDWSYATDATSIRWTDADAAHSLGWGELYSFTVVSSKAPVRGTATLHASNAPTAAAIQVATYVPSR